MDLQNIIYQLEDGRYWCVQKASYIDTPQEERTVIPLYADGKPAGEEYLIRTLRFYGYPLGELSKKDEQGILDALAALDAKYLTPRVLAGLATGDQYAAGQWAEHETEAGPLREKLAALRSA
mgnify:FL=1